MSNLWIEVDLDAVKHNYHQIMARISERSTLMAVIKADAYGLGAVEVAKMLQDEGCNAFAVTTVSEALILRRHGVTGRILVLGPTTEEEWALSIDAEVELTVSQIDWIPKIDSIASKTHRNAIIHLKIETGMGRTGFSEDKLSDLALVLEKTSSIYIAGAYTHFARGAQRDHEYTRTQHERFIRSIHKLQESGVIIPTKHVCNSAAFLDFPEYHYDFVRVGTLLGGHFPSPTFASKVNLKDPWIVKSRITHVQKAPKGTYVGYQSIYKTKSETYLAVIPVGYADGFGMEPKLVPQGVFDLAKIIVKNIAALLGLQLGKEKILFRGKAVNVAGKVGMQLTVLDTGIEQGELGEEVVVPLRRTIANPRIPRIYKKNGEIFRKRIIEEGFLSLNTEYSNTP